PPLLVLLLSPPLLVLLPLAGRRWGLDRRCLHWPLAGLMLPLLWCGGLLLAAAGRSLLVPGGPAGLRG
ncbi:MAG: hypothetical protein ACK56I_20905, partial [bacterium]